MLGKYVNILQLIDYLEGSIDGRKKLQKLVYLIQHKGGPFEEAFQYHLYGPFSEQLANELEEMKTFGLVKETRELAYSGSKYKYRYSITQGGRKVLQSKSNSDLEPFKNLIKTLGQYDARKLELMATSLFLSKSAYNFNNTNLVEHIKHLKSEQNYTTTEIEDSLQYLYDHGFVQKP